MLELVAERMRGEIAAFDIRDEKGEVIVERGRRITARHIRLMEKAGLETLQVPPEYIVGRSLARDIVDTDTGEVLLDCNTELTADMLGKLAAKGIKRIETIYTNELDCGPFVSETLRIRPDPQPAGSAGRDLPHDAPRRAADARSGGEPVQQPVLLGRALRPLRGRPHEVQPPSRPRRGRRARACSAARTSSTCCAR